MMRAWLLARWARPGPGITSTLLAPLAWLYGRLQVRDRRIQEEQARRLKQPACPVLVVGNLVAGGAGKTPTTIAIVQALQEAGRRPGVVSRGHGRRSAAVQPVHRSSTPEEAGDEPLLIRRRSGAPVWVGRDRVAAARELLAQHPEVDVIVADDGLQHRRLQRMLEVVVFDERGIGNGFLLPAGPLREPFTPAPPPQALVLYNHPQPTTPWPGACAERRLVSAWPLAAWLSGETTAAQPLASLLGRPLLAMAGIAVPQRFFDALKAANLDIRPLPLPDHHRYEHAPWPAGTHELVTTEKDAVKLARWADTTGPTIWVVGLDLALPAAFTAELLRRLQAAAAPAPTTAPLHP